MNGCRVRAALGSCVLLVAIVVSGCTLFEDNGTHLAYALEKGANELRRSSSTELVVHYEPLDGPNERYYVEITPSLAESAPASTVWSSYLVVSGKSSGGTSYHNRFVFVPGRLRIEKEKGTTDLVLKKDGDRISVVEVR
jgi:hypothetical protein